MRPTLQLRKQAISDWLNSDPEYTRQLLLRLNALQTQWEQQVEQTLEDNGVGFNSADAPVLTQIAQAATDRPLTAEELAVCRHRLPKYWRLGETLLVEGWPALSPQQQPFKMPIGAALEGTDKLPDAA